jgi:hypothetical protein
MNNFKKLKWPLIGGAIGGLAGYLYWYFYGCENGCAISGSAVNSTLYFAFMGALFPGMFKKNKATKLPIQ